MKFHDMEFHFGLTGNFLKVAVIMLAKIYVTAMFYGILRGGKTPKYLATTYLYIFGNETPFWFSQFTLSPTACILIDDNIMLQVVKFMTSIQDNSTIHRRKKKKKK